jgi:putative transcriptional regulator
MTRLMNGDPDIPTLIRRLRERTGLTQEKCAARLGVTFPTINRWENGHAKPSPLALKQIETMVRDLGDEGKDLLSELFGGGDEP